MEQLDDCELFGRYLAKWQCDTRFLSSVSAITAHPAFIGIVNMGECCAIHSQGD